MERAARGELLGSAIYGYDCVTQSQFDGDYDCSHSLQDGIMRATVGMIGGKPAHVCGFGDVGKRGPFAMRGVGARH